MNDFYQTFLHAYGRKLPAPMINPHIHKQKKTHGKRSSRSSGKMAYIPGEDIRHLGQRWRTSPAGVVLTGSGKLYHSTYTLHNQSKVHFRASVGITKNPSLPPKFWLSSHSVPTLRLNLSFTRLNLSRLTQN